jgi:hypothetical protein
LPALPQSDTDIRTCHDARVSPDTIVPAWYGDRLNLHETIWACFADARLAKEKREAAAAQPGR